MKTVTTRTVECPADGLTMVGHFALPAGAWRRPGVLVGPEGMGLGDVERRRAEALAELAEDAVHFACASPSGVSPRLLFQRVPEGKVVKNRVHLDVPASVGLVGDERLAALEADCAR